MQKLGQKTLNWPIGQIHLGRHRNRNSGLVRQRSGPEVRGYLYRSGASRTGTPPPKTHGGSRIASSSTTHCSLKISSETNHHRAVAFNTESHALALRLRRATPVTVLSKNRICHLTPRGDPHLYSSRACAREDKPQRAENENSFFHPIARSQSGEVHVEPPPLSSCLSAMNRVRHQVTCKTSRVSSSLNSVTRSRFTT